MSSFLIFSWTDPETFFLYILGTTLLIFIFKEVELMKNSFDHVMEKALLIKKNCKELLNLMPMDQWKNFDETTQESIYTYILDKSLELENIYEELSNVLYSTTLPAIMLHEPANINKKGNTYTNKGMTTTLLDGHVAFKDKNGNFEGNDLLRDLLFHLYTNVKFVNIIKKSDTPRKAYNYIFTCTKHKLVDQCRKINKVNPVDFEPLDGTSTTKDGEKINRQYASKVNIEKQLFAPRIEIIVKNATELLLPQLIPLMKKHPERLLTYLNTMAGNTPANLVEKINNHGYNITLNSLIEKLLQEGVDVSDLKNKNLNFKVKSDCVKPQHVYNWTNRMHRDFKENKRIKEVIENFVLNYASL